MYTKLYYNGTLIDSLNRMFTYAGVLKAEITVDGKDLVVDRSDLTETPILVKQDIEGVEGDNSNADTVSSDVNESRTKVVKEAQEEVVSAVEEEQLVEVETVEDSEVVQPKRIVAIKQSNNRKIQLDELDSVKFSNFIKRNKLDKAAVLNVLEGKQKTHKGYSFQYA